MFVAQPSRPETRTSAAAALAVIEGLSEQFKNNGVSSFAAAFGLRAVIFHLGWSPEELLRLYEKR